MSAASGAHTHPDPPRPAIGLTTGYPREGRTEDQEWQTVRAATLRPERVWQRYSFFPADRWPTDDNIPALAIDIGTRHRMIAVKPPAQEVADGLWHERILTLAGSFPVDGFDTRFVFIQEPYRAGYRYSAQKATFRAGAAAFRDTIRELGRSDLLVGLNLQSWDFNAAAGYRGRDYLIGGLDFVGVTALGTDAGTLAGLGEDVGLAAYHADSVGARFAICSLPLSPSQPEPDMRAMMASLRTFVAARAAAGLPLDHLNSWAGPFGGSTWGPDESPAVLREFRMLIDALGPTTP